MTTNGTAFLSTTTPFHSCATDLAFSCFFRCASHPQISNVDTVRSTEVGMIESRTSRTSIGMQTPIGQLQSTLVNTDSHGFSRGTPQVRRLGPHTRDSYGFSRGTPQVRRLGPHTRVAREPSSGPGEPGRPRSPVRPRGRLGWAEAVWAVVPDHTGGR